MLSLTGPEYLNKSTFVSKVAADAGIDKGLVFSNYDVWYSHRKVIGRTLTNNGVLEQLRKVNLHTKELIHNLLSSANNKIDGLDGMPISKLIIQRQFKLNYNFDFQIAKRKLPDIIMDLEITSKSERLEFHKHLMIAKSGFSERFRQPWLLLPPIYWLHPIRQRINKATEEIRKFIEVIINRYEKRNARKNAEKSTNETDIDVNPVKCMMREMIDAGFSDNDILHEMLTMIYAGHETSSVTVILFLVRLALNPKIQKRCREEIDEFYSRKLGKGENSLQPVLTMGDLNELEYLDRCMKETMRLTPIVPAFTRTLNAPVELEEDIVLDKGVIVAFTPWAMHRNPENFPDPEKFDPDCFLPEECAKRHPFAYLPFSAGARKCLGWKIGPLIIKLMAAMILRHFEIETTDKWEKMQFEYDITLKHKNDVNIILKKRQDII